jgi:hypothetical protein
MGKLPALLLTAIAIWIGWTVYQQGPDHAFGGLGALIESPQYGEADRPTHSGSLADRVLEGDPAEQR